MIRSQQNFQTKGCSIPRCLCAEFRADGDRDVVSDGLAGSCIRLHRRRERHAVLPVPGHRRIAADGAKRSPALARRAVVVLAFAAIGASAGSFLVTRFYDDPGALGLAVPILSALALGAIGARMRVLGLKY